MSVIDFVVNYEGVETDIRITRSTRMHKVLCACCDRLGLNPENYILSKEGVQINEKESAEYNHVKNGDMLTIEK